MTRNLRSRGNVTARVHSSVFQSKGNNKPVSPRTNKRSHSPKKYATKKASSPEQHQASPKSPKLLSRTSSYNSQYESSLIGSSICDRTIYPSSLSVSSFDYVGMNILDGLSSSGSSTSSSDKLVLEEKDYDMFSIWGTGPQIDGSYKTRSSTPVLKKCDSFDSNDPHKFFATERAVKEEERRLARNGSPASISSLTEKMALNSSPGSDHSQSVYCLRSQSRKRN